MHRPSLQVFSKDEEIPASDSQRAAFRIALWTESGLLEMNFLETINEHVTTTTPLETN